MSDIYQAPEAALNEPVASGQYGSVESAIAGNYELKPIEIYKDAWASLNGMKGTFWGAFIVYYLVLIAITFVFGLFIVGSAQQGGDPAGFFVAQIGMQFVQIFVMMPMAMGLVMIALKHSVGANIQFGEVFKHFNKAVPLFLTYLLMTIIVMIGFVLLVLPGIYLLVAYSMAMVLVVEKGMGPWEALETSRKAVSKKWFNFVGLMIISVVVIILGSIALLVGLVWALPLAVLAYAIAYRDIFGVEATTLND